MKRFLLMLLFACSLSTVAAGCADEVNAEGDINPDEDGDDTADEGAAGMGGDPDPVDECVASCNDDACAAACED